MTAQMIAKLVQDFYSMFKNGLAAGHPGEKDKLHGFD